MIVCDTTVLVYAVGEAHPLREPARRLVRSVTDGRVEMRTSVEVIQEFVHVRSRRRGRDDAVRYARDYGILLAPLVTTLALDLETGLEIFRSTRRLGAFDAVLAAVALRESATAFVSADGSFGDVPGLPFVDLGSSEFEDLVGP